MEIYFHIFFKNLHNSAQLKPVPPVWWHWNYCKGNTSCKTGQLDGTYWLYLCGRKTDVGYAQPRCSYSAGLLRGSSDALAGPIASLMNSWVPRHTADWWLIGIRQKRRERVQALGGNREIPSRSDLDVFHSVTRQHQWPFVSASASLSLSHEKPEICTISQGQDRHCRCWYMLV